MFTDLICLNYCGEEENENTIKIKSVNIISSKTTAFQKHVSCS